MAIMYPKGGPVRNASYTAEPTVYHALARQLSDDFVVIHSIPWLAQVAKEVDGRHVPTGEIDFLILHQTLGILALEVKGGKIHYEHNMAVLPNGNRFDPVAQVRRGIHGLAQWVFKASGISYRFGYGVVFPQSIVKGRSLPPALIDMTNGTPQSICLDQQDLSAVGTHVKHIMHYWQTALNNRPLSQTTITTIIKLLIPDPDFTPTWVERFELTRQKHLQLTVQQSIRLRQIESHPRFVLTGRSGTGKTLLAVEYAQRLAGQGKRVLFLVYNVALTTAIKKELREFQRSGTQQGPAIQVRNYHELCRFAANQLGRTSEYEKGKRWFTTLSHRALHDAIQKNLMGSYDALIIDEGQVFHADWLTTLEQWFASKPIFLCCDETQSFAYEHKTPADEIAKILNAPSPFILTFNMRSPKPVFDRLQQVITSTYEQQSQRDDEPETLQERLTADPLEQLHHVIEQLQKDGIPPEHIMVIYWNTPPSYQDGFERLVGQTISVYKCRGIEAPVVVIWINADPVDDITWACAYSRATDRCIAIYHPATLLKHHGDTHFAQILVSEDLHLSQWVLQQQEIERQQREIERQQREHRELQRKEMREKRAIWPSPSWQIMTFEQAVFQWSRTWKAWYLPKQATRIETLLWAMHIAITSFHDVYAEGQFFEGEIRYLYKFSAVSNILKISPKEVPIAWCQKCQKWSRGYIMSNMFNNTWHCSDCLTEPVHTLSDDVGKEEKASLLRSAQQIIMECEECKTVFSLALFYWSELSPTQKKFVEEHCRNRDDPLKWVARIITATEILAADPGAFIETATIHHFSWEGCPWLATQMDETQWFEVLTLGMRFWARYKAVRKKMKGVYEALRLGSNQNESEVSEQKM